MSVAKHHPDSQQLLNSPMAGSDVWWQQIAQWGTPLTEPAGEGKVKLTFLWRDRQGKASDAVFSRVYIDVNGVTDHHSVNPETLQRLGQTDVWYWQAEVASDFRGSYSFIPAPAEKSLNLPQGSPQERRLAQRNGWLSLMELAENDPLNLTAAHASYRGKPLSAVHLADALPQTAWQPIDAGQSLPPDPQRLQLITWHSPLLGNSRHVWIYSTRGAKSNNGAKNLADRPLAILLDGQYWAQRQPLFGVLDNETAAGRLPATVYVLIDIIDQAHRSQELPCNPNFWQALQTELLPQVAELQPFTELASRTVVAGQSFGGLASLYAGLHWPQRFGCVLSQSGSFWWPDVDNLRMLAAETAEHQGWLTDQVLQGLGANHPLNIFMEAGRYEAVIYQVNEVMSEALRRAGHRLQYRVYSGGHDSLCWRGGLIEGLGGLLGSGFG
ncbi:Enterochelin esterase [Yersinia mollaretii ATCC 43969]|uniref:Enterochelin esterase n=3 Tax=Yersinia mollaretii TaxID=33060 RepID=A0ABM9YAZ2_YERMW|nr:enterochelin esterase [Yersinia mollaretii]EEQ11077.1 Enterochelin esterase [Yersinia mollaretii ATCC 43969]QKJ01826.1 enterochelin esterase [Yersinia mollaretii ATCC 43969]